MGQKRRFRSHLHALVKSAKVAASLRDTMKTPHPFLVMAELIVAEKCIGDARSINRKQWRVRFQAPSIT